jgi:hypothetical protein
MLFNYGYGQQWNKQLQKCRQIDGSFDPNAGGAIRHNAHRPMEHIRGFMQSHQMPPSGKCLHRIAPAAAMVDDFE